MRFLTSNGYEFLVDDEDAAIVGDYGWSGQDCNGLVYVRRRRWDSAERRYRSCRLHRAILGVEGLPVCVDHINGNGLDNRRSNLRVATASQNNVNCKMRETNTTGFRGVYWHKPSSRWTAQLGKDGKRLHLGMFDTPEDAARAYNNAAKREHGEYARMNVGV